MNTKKLLKAAACIILMAILGLSSNMAYGAAAVTQSNFTSVITPQYMNGGTSNRMPVIFRATVSGLTASTSYRYYVQGVTNSTAGGGTVDFGGTNSGAGNSMLISTAGVFTYPASPGLSTAGTYETFTTNAAGSFTGWFAFVNTSNARFTAGNTIYPCITINGGGTSTTVTYRFALDVGISVLTFATTTAATSGSMLQSTSCAVAGNVVAVYDAIPASGRPLSCTYVETEPTVASVPASYLTTAGSWSVIVPNNNANGIRTIQQYSVITGTTTGLTATSSNGTWATGSVNTVNQTNGTTSKLISSSDAPLGSSQLTASPTTLSAFTFSSGTASTSQSFNLSGSCLSGAALTVDAPTNFEVSLNNSTWGTSVAPAYTGFNLASTPIYVRVAATAPSGAISGNVKCYGGGIVIGSATNVAVSGTGTSVVLNVSQSSLSGFSASAVTASASQSYTITAAGLSPATGNFSVYTSTTDWELSTDNSTWNTYTSGSPLTSVTYSSAGTVTSPSPADVYVRLKSGLTTGSKSGTITNAGANATNQSVSVSGTVQSPSLSTSVSTLSPFCATATTSNAKSFTVTGAALSTATGNLSIVVSPNNNFELSADGGATWSSSLSPAFAGGAYSTGTPFQIRLKTGLSVTTGLTATITVSGGGATSTTIALSSGEVTNATLGVGDVSIVGYRATSNDGAAFATWVDLPNGTVLSLTDNAYTGAATLATTENTLVWTNNTGGVISAGTVVVIGGTAQGNGTGVDLGTITSGNLNGNSSSGDNLFIYQGTTGCPTFLYGINYGSAWLTTGTATSNTSYLPAALNVANGNINFTASSATDGQYTGLRDDQASIAAYKPIASNATNWTVATGTVSTPVLNSTDFIVQGVANLSASATSVTESASPTVVTLTVSTGSTPVTGDQTVDIAVTGITPTTRYTLGSPTVTILDGQTSGTTNFQINNDAVYEGTQTATVTISNPSAGLNLGAVTTKTITVLDDETPPAVTYYAVGSGVAETGAIWSLTPTGTGSTITAIGPFAINKDVVIQSGYTVTMNGSNGITAANLTVQPNAQLKAAVTATPPYYINVYGNLTVNGTLGNNTGATEYLGLNMEGANQTVSGNGTIDLLRLRKSTNTNVITNVTLARNMNLWYPNVALYNNFSGTTSFNVTVNSGVTLNLEGNGDLSMDGTDGTGSGTRTGLITVLGTVTGVDTIYGSTNNSATTPAIGFSIDNGGVVDANRVMLSIGGGGYAFDVLTGGHLNVSKALELRAGTFSPAGIVTLKSTSITSAAYLDNFTTGFTGTYGANKQISVERYYDASTTYNQHFMGSPVDQPSFSQFGASGTQGFMVPYTPTQCDERYIHAGSPYGTVFSYHEDNGSTCSTKQWYVETSGTATNGKGYSILKNGAGVLTLTGVPNLLTSYTVTGSNTAWSQYTTFQSRPVAPGWVLLANPYPAAISLPANTGSFNPGYSNEVHVWNTDAVNGGSYASLTAGTNAVIAPGQAFMVHLLNGGSTQVTAPYTILASSRVKAGATFHAQHADELTIVATNTATGTLDNTVIGFSPSTTAQFDPQIDNFKGAGALGRHTLYSYTTNSMDWMAINMFHTINETNTVNVGFEAAGTGTNYSFSFDGINSFDPTVYMFLEDKKLNVMHNLRDGAYSFTADSADNFNRFVVHFTPPVQITATDAGCNTSGMIEVVQPGTANWNYTLNDATNTVVSTGTLSQASPIALNTAAGSYSLTLTDNSGYTVVKNIVVNATPVAPATFTVSAGSVQQGQDVVVTATEANANTYDWTFGNGATATGQSVTLNYATPGVYTVSLTVTNVSGCSSTTSQQLTVAAATGIADLNNNNAIEVWSNGNKLYVDLSHLQKVDATISIFNILGQQISNEKWTNSTVYQKEVDNMQTAYLMVRVKNGTEVMTRKVLIVNNK